jgi:hypothetical protein
VGYLIDFYEAWSSFLGEVMKCCCVKIISVFFVFFVIQSCAMEHEPESKERVIHKKIGVRALLDAGNYEGALGVLSDAIKARRYDDCVTILVYLIQNHFFIEPTMKVVRNVSAAKYAEKTRLALSLKFKDKPKELAKISIASDRSVGQVRSRLIKILQKTNNQIIEILRLMNQQASKSTHEKNAAHFDSKIDMGIGINGHFPTQ